MSRNRPTERAGPPSSKFGQSRSMASATGIPDNMGNARGGGEDEPLLGGPGAATQSADKPIIHNLVGGTAVIAQAGIWVLAAIVWSAVLSVPFSLFSAHPLLNSGGIVLVTQAILILQPTSTPTQKKRGTYSHSTLNNLGLASLAAGLVVIEYNKIKSGNDHFYSVHAILGLITYIFLLVQGLVGFTAFFVPQLYGGVNNAKSLYKYHRASGYIVLVLTLATVCAATTTSFNATLKIQLWTVIVASVIVLVGIVPRVKKHKLGL